MLKKREREKLNTEINVVPLVDIMMVLLIIFMVTTPFIMQGSI
ncbi:MAG TPA: biopolymer transporter ExbD, partial [Candidatus Goldiibacteriota bacterium]|nr:biopolymer transporter ExbD [Candidatus Goldiibacteriota bacterium]